MTSLCEYSNEHVDMDSPDGDDDSSSEDSSLVNTFSAPYWSLAKGHPH